MSHETLCSFCNGTGRVTVYEPWERAHLLIDRAFQIVANGWSDHVVSLDVDENYPMAIDVRRGQDDLGAVEEQLSCWARHGDDLYAGPLNDNGGIWEPIDPRFYE